MKRGDPNRNCKNEPNPISLAESALIFIVICKRIVDFYLEFQGIAHLHCKLIVLYNGHRWNGPECGEMGPVIA
jgi:hypothetical protein